MEVLKIVHYIWLLLKGNTIVDTFLKKRNYIHLFIYIVIVQIDAFINIYFSIMEKADRYIVHPVTVRKKKSDQF